MAGLEKAGVGTGCRIVLHSRMKHGLAKRGQRASTAVNNHEWNDAVKTEVRTSIEGLEIGMYVSRLDRPWLQTPFALQGLLIKTSDDIEKLRKYCNYVYVDVDRGGSPDPGYWILSEVPHGQPEPEPEPSQPAANTAIWQDTRDDFSQLRKHDYKLATRFTDELQTSRTLYENISADLQQMFSAVESRGELDIRVIKKGIADMTESIIRNPSAMMWIVSLRSMDNYIYARAISTSVWCASFGRHLGLEKPAIEKLAIGGLLLDIGKTSLPRELLSKKGALSPEELNKLHAHVDIGVKLLASASRAASGNSLPPEVLQMIATHHERADGSGYPQHLKNNEIPLFGRIAGIVDSYDAMNSTSPHTESRPKSPHEAISELYETRGKKFQAELIEQFIQAVGLYPTGSLVELSTGEVGAVVAINGLRRLRPTVIVLLDKNKEPLPDFIMTDLSKTNEHVTVVRGLPAGSYGIDMNELFL